MQIYGYLFGVIKTIKDTHHDEVFVEATGHVIIQNNIFLVDYDQLVAIAREMGISLHRFSLIRDVIDNDGN